MDSMLLTSRIVHGHNLMLAIICDGVGSLADSVVASSIAIKYMSEWFSSLSDAERTGLRMRDAVLDANCRIVSHAQQMGIQTATTLSALLLLDAKYHIVNIGDSRVYCYEDGQLTQLTSDDVSESGKLSACIGCAGDPILAYQEGAIGGRHFLLCSDGFYKRMDAGFLLAELNFKNKKHVKKSITRPTNYVIERGEKDNITIALIKPV